MKITSNTMLHETPLSLETSDLAKNVHVRNIRKGTRKSKSSMLRHAFSAEYLDKMRYHIEGALNTQPVQMLTVNRRYFMKKDELSRLWEFHKKSTASQTLPHLFNAVLYTYLKKCKDTLIKEQT